MSTPVKRWAPRYVDALRLALKPLIAYFVFCALAFVAFVITILADTDRSNHEDVYLIIGCFAGMVGVLLGQLVAIARVRIFPLFIVSAILYTFASFTIAGIGFIVPRELIIPVAFFSFAFPCGLFSLQHRYELFSAFWPSIGWIGSAMIILNRHGRVHEWEESKVSVWLPIPLALLGAFLFFLLLYLAAKQAMRVQLWQALSGSLERRISKKASPVAAIPRRNLLSLLAIAGMLFVFTAVMAPYLWRTGKGDREGHSRSTRPDTSEEEREPRDGPQFDEEAIRRMMRSVASGAKSAATTLWPLLLLFVFYRPIKRALLTSHLKTPIVPTPPSERVDNLWEYVRIAAEDAGVVPAPSDSIEDLVGRIRESRPITPELLQAAAIYEETRYGFVVKPGAPRAMKQASLVAGKSLKSDMTYLDHIKSWWRPLS